MKPNCVLFLNEGNHGDGHSKDKNGNCYIKQSGFTKEIDLNLHENGDHSDMELFYDIVQRQFNITEAKEVFCNSKNMQMFLYSSPMKNEQQEPLNEQKFPMECDTFQHFSIEPNSDYSRSTVGIRHFFSSNSTEVLNQHYLGGKKDGIYLTVNRTAGNDQHFELEVGHMFLLKKVLKHSLYYGTDQNGNSTFDI